MINSRYILIIAIIGGFVLTACNKPSEEEMRDTYIQQLLNNRINNYKKRRIDNCVKDIIEEAGHIADSVLLQRALMSKDTLDRPQRPEKPSKPQEKQRPDSLELKPIFKDSSFHIINEIDKKQ